MPQNLYTYCVLQDNWSNPNPFWGVSTLAICKPQIRKFAKIWDRIVRTRAIKKDFANQVDIFSKITYGESRY